MNPISLKKNPKQNTKKPNQPNKNYQTKKNPNKEKPTKRGARVSERDSIGTVQP